jgi:TolB-like protein/Tfp pilus assembly protein PilF
VAWTRRAGFAQQPGIRVRLCRTAAIGMRTIYELGPFRLDTEARVLTHDGVATALGARGVAVLAALVSRAGEYVEKSAIVEEAWPGVVVEDANLAVQISAIRRVLAGVPDGEHWIETLTRRGYRFIGPVAPSPGESATPSLAVLPFVNRSHDPEDEYFSDGLADELLNVLAKIRGLRVAARTSSFQFKGRMVDISVIGRKLNVATVLEGSVRKAGNRMRITVQLVKVTDGYQLWSESYDRTLQDIFAVQDDIAQSVVKELRATLLGETLDAKAATEVTAQVAAAIKGRATDAEAHRLYLQARHFIDRMNRADTAKGIEYLEQALDRDPTFALARADLSRAYANEADYGWAPPAEGARRAREAVARALALEPELAEGHAALGRIQLIFDWDWRGAAASYARALELAPGNAAVLRRAGVLAANLGRFDEALGLYRRAIDQDPLSAGAYHNLGNALHAAGRLAEAEQAHRKTLEFSPQQVMTRYLLALNLLAQGRSEEALTEALREPHEAYRLCALAIIHHAAGRQVEADAALHELIAKRGDDAAYQVAMVYAAGGETDLAFEWLERAYAQRDSGLSEMKIQPWLRPLHTDPRWGAFLRKMGLAD